MQSEKNLEKGWREVHLSCGRLESSEQSGIPVGNGSVLKTNAECLALMVLWLDRMELLLLFDP